MKKIKNVHKKVLLVASILLGGYLYNQAQPQFELPPLDPPCSPICLDDPEITRYSISEISFNKPPPASYAPGEKAEVSFKYYSVDTVDIHISLIPSDPYTSCRNHVFAENNLYLPGQSTATYKWVCSEKGQIDSLKFSFIPFSTEDTVYEKTVSYRAIWAADSISHVRITPRNPEPGISIPEAQEFQMNIGDTIDVHFVYSTRYTGNVDFEIVPYKETEVTVDEIATLKSSSSFITIPKAIQNYSYEFPQKPFFHKEFQVLGHLMVKEPGIISQIDIRMKASDTDSLFDMVRFDEKSFVFSNTNTNQINSRLNNTHILPEKSVQHGSINGWKWILQKADALGRKMK